MQIANGYEIFKGHYVILEAEIRNHNGAKRLSKVLALKLGFHMFRGQRAIT